MKYFIGVMLFLILFFDATMIMGLYMEHRYERQGKMAGKDREENASVYVIRERSDYVQYPDGTVVFGNLRGSYVVKDGKMTYLPYKGELRTAQAPATTDGQPPVAIGGAK